MTKVEPDFSALSRTRAAIDVGSNSVRMLFRNKKSVEITALSEGLLNTGVLSREAMIRTSDQIFKFQTEALKNGAEEVFVFATEAVRAAKNRAEFITLLSGCGISLDVLSSDREAKIGFSGASIGGNCAVADIGGASSELVVGKDSEILYAHSLPLGCVRLFDYSDDLEEERRFARERMEEYGQIPPFDTLVVIGGTSSTFVAVKEKLEPYDPEVVQDYRLTLRDVDEITELFAKTPLSEREKIVGLQPKKAKTAVSSGVMLSELLQYLGRNDCIVSERDNLEGYLLSKR